MLLNECSGAFSQLRTWELGRELAFGILNCAGRQTITGMLTASGKQFMDWTSAYRLFSHQRVDTNKLFEVARQRYLQELSPDQMIIAHMDDTLIPKTGKRIPGTAWRRDPLGPPFHTNFIWGQRFIQLSLALPDEAGCQSRAIPIDLHHCPTPKRPGKKATEQDILDFKEKQKQLRLSKQGSERIKKLREDLNKQGHGEKELVLSVDGSYTNEQVLKNLPDKVTLIGRARKDTKLYALPESQPELGRKRVYGDQLPTPEQIRLSDQIPWVQVKGWAAGKTHSFDVKVVKDVLWRSAGQKHLMQLVVIRPLGYRLTRSSKMLYREPAYLVCTNNDLSIEKLLQAYLWRWEIEVNFKEQKTILGCGEAQVRNPGSVTRVPAFVTAIYSLLHLAAHRSTKNTKQPMLPRPKWYPKKEQRRHTTGDLINNIKAQAWSRSIGLNFSSFVSLESKTRSLRNIANPGTAAMLYMRK